MTREVTYPAPPFDAELIPILQSGQVPSTVDVESMLGRRTPPQLAAVDALLAERGLIRNDLTVPGSGGRPDITVSAIRKQAHVAGGPGIFFAHGGGMVTGDRFNGMDRFLRWVEQFDAVVVTVEYRLAPDHPDPAPLDDCFAGLVWCAANAAELGFDPGRLIAVGLSAGAGLIAGAVLRVRDQHGPHLAGQMLLAPMLDDRNTTVSSHQIQGIGVWDRSSNDAAWTALLGARRGTDDVSPYSAPARATDLSGLPPTYIDCGSAEVFRDEAVAYASKIWSDAGAAELHVWPGGFHGFDGIVPDSALARSAHTARADFIRRILSTRVSRSS